MAISKSIGYDGSVGESEHASLMQVAGSQNYGVSGANDWLVSVDTSRDRGVRVGPGWGYGFGILDYNDGDVSLACEVATTVRWDTIVARRDAANNRTTFAVIRGGTAAVAASTARTPGGISEQPLALARVTPGDARVVLTSLRTWQEKITTCETTAGLPFPWPGAVAHVGALSAERVEWRVRYVNGALGWYQYTPPGSYLGDAQGTFYALSPESSTSPRRVWGANGEIIARVDLPDFGRPALVDLRFFAEMGTSRPDGLRWDIHLHLDSPNGVNLGYQVGRTGLGRSIDFYDLRPVSVRVEAGSHSIFAVARGTILDTGNYGYGIITPFNRGITAVATAL